MSAVLETFVCLGCDQPFTPIVHRNRERKLRCEACWAENESKRNAETARLWRVRNAEYVRANDSERHKEKRRTDPAYRARTNERAIAWGIANREAVNAAAKRWRERNPDKVHAAGQARRARLLGAKGSFTPDEFSELCVRHDQRCVYCGERKKLGPDHNIPLSRGGSNDIANIVPACQSCNASKRDKTLAEFLATRR